jgi:hypothetical protein
MAAGVKRRVAPPVVLTVLSVLVAVMAPAAEQPAAASVAQLPPPPLTAGPGETAEATLAADPANANRLAVAADPYLDPVHIVVAQSEDGGQTWSPPVSLVPPGFVKSYDPVLLFASDGSLVVVGGSSGVGRANCQPRSAIFAATLSRAGAPTYRLIRDARVDGAYVDRPAAANDAAGSLYVSWTESTGPAAECRGVPTRAVARFAHARADGTVEPVLTLPGTGLAASFGSAVLVTGGSVQVAVGERDIVRRRLVVTESRDGGATFEAATIVSERPVHPTALPGLGGIVAPAPSLAAAADGRRALTDIERGDDGRLRAVVFERSPSAGWQRLVDPPVVAPQTVLAAAVYDRAGRLWLATAQLSSPTLTFALTSYSGRWETAAPVAASPAARFEELGESLGLVAVEERILTAVPIDASGGSNVSLYAVAAPPPPPPSTTTTSSRPSTTARPRPKAVVRRHDRHQFPFAALLSALLVVGMAGAVVVQRSRVARRRAARRRSSFLASENARPRDRR